MPAVFLLKPTLQIMKAFSIGELYYIYEVYNMKSKITSTLLLLGALCLVTACDSGSTSSTPTTPAPTISSLTTPTPSVPTPANTTSAAIPSSTGSAIYYGKVIFNHIYVYDGYDGVKIRPTFTNPEVTKDEIFVYEPVDETICYIDDYDQVFYLTPGFTKVNATSQHFKTSFLVFTSTDTSFWGGSAHSNKSVIKAYDEPDQTVFIGDSFFDFWKQGIGITKKFSDYYGEYKAYNIGIGGTETKHWRAMNTGGLFTLESAPKNIIINLGTNNINNSAESGQQLYLNMLSLVEDYLEWFPEVNVYLFSITRCTGGFAANWTRASDYNDLMKKYCETDDQVTFLDVMEIYGDNYASYLTDGLHQNDAGYEVFDDLIQKHVSLIAK